MDRNSILKWATVSALGLGLVACSSAPMNEEEKTMAMKTAKAATPETVDQFLWLEEVEGEKPLEKVRSWNKRTLDELEQDPRYEGLLAEAKAILTSDERIANPGIRGGEVYNFWQDKTSVRGLWRTMSMADYLAGKENWDVIIDFDKLAKAEDENWVYKGVDCLEPDYARCMVTLSRGGSDASVR
ncbi:MAG: hypothetical protein V3V30_03275, partial [Parvularculaceae bacterium]